MKNSSSKVVLVLAMVCYTLNINSFNEKSVPIVQEKRDKDTIRVTTESDSIFMKGKFLYHKKEYKAAISYFLKSDSVISSHFGKECPYYGYGTKWTASCYHKLGMDSIALEFSIYYDKQPIDKLLTHSSDSVIWIALRLIDLGQIKNATEKLSEAALLEKQELGPKSYWYANTLSVCSGLYSEIGNFGKAIEYGKEAVEIYKETFGINHPNYATCLNNLAACYADEGKEFLAIQLCREALDIKKRLFGIDNSDYADDLSNLATFYSSVGNYNEALQLGTQAMNIRRRILGPIHPDYAISLINLADDYSQVGNFPKALLYGTEAMEIWGKHSGTSHPDYATALSHIAIYYSDLGNYNKALQLETEAMKIRKEVLGNEHPNYLTSLSNYTLYNAYLGNYSKAIQIGNEVVELDKNIYGALHPKYAAALARLASYYSCTGDFVEAKQLYINALDIWNNVYGSEHPGYAYILNNLAKQNASLGLYTEALQEGKEVLNILKRVFGTEHPNYALSLSDLGSFYSHIGNYAEAYNLYNQHIDCSQSYILNNFVELSSNLRKSLWTNKFSSNYINTFPSIVEKYQNKKSISKLYDVTCLFAKGILLNTDIEMRKLILESGDTTLIAKYNNLSTNINIYNKLIKTPVDKRFINSDSLNNVIQRQEMELAKDSKVYGDFIHNLTIKWGDVQKRLGDNDIAIEFLDFPIENTDSTMYVALTIKKGYDSPHMVTLFEEKQLKAIQEEDYYTHTNLSSLVWKPLESELRDVRNIYFAPSGELHRIGIEYIPISNTEEISDIYTLHRLSSTRQLAIIQDKPDGKNTILYGGINYDEKPSFFEHDFTSADETVLRSAFSRANVDSLSLRSSFDYLEGTKRETDMIAKDMEQHSVPYVYYSGINGSEESFKNLDGTRPKTMHIATHGFYYTKSETENSQFARPEIELMVDGFQNTGQFIEDKTMTRSGLLFSGCNRAFRHEQIPEGEEDGILTAQEISTLDLRGLDLVVLSACQTGLGEISSGEGVFGLQRGFKNAGAKTILMSLDKVDDEATRILMVEFYRNLMSGKTKHQSLREAQQYLRKIDNGKYNDPKYWAPFIMLDGIG